MNPVMWYDLTIGSIYILKLLYSANNANIDYWVGIWLGNEINMLGDVEFYFFIEGEKRWVIFDDKNDLFFPDTDEYFICYDVEDYCNNN